MPHQINETKLSLHYSGILELESEKLVLRIKHIKFDDIGGVILVNGKTGPRRESRAVWSVDCLKDWLKDHLDQNNPEAPLWFNFAKKTKKMEVMQYGAIRMRLNRISKRLS
jgi:integrase